MWVPPFHLPVSRKAFLHALLYLRLERKERGGRGKEEEGEKERREEA